MAEKNTILYLIDGLEYGGGERVFLQLIRGLKSRYMIAAAADPGGIFRERVEDVGIFFLPLPMKSRFSFLSLFLLVRFLKNQKVSLMHSQGSRADFLAGAASMFCHSIPWVSTVAMPVEGFDISPFRKRIYLLFDRLAAAGVDRFIVVSDSLKNFFANVRRIPAIKIVRIYNGIEIENDPAAKDLYRKKWDISDNAFVIGAVGRMVWQKGFEYLIRAMPPLIRRFPYIRFLLVGEGPLRKSLEEQAMKLGIEEHLIFTGYLENVDSAIAAMDLVVIPSLREGFPMITLEAMVQGKPIVASRIPGITEQLNHGTTGMLIEPASSESIIEAILEIIGNKELAALIGMNAKEEVIRSFSVEKMIHQTDYVYKHLLKLK